MNTIEQVSSGIVGYLRRYRTLPPARAEAALAGTATATAERGALSIDHVSISYRDRCILRRASLSVQKGEIFALIGPSGCGKSSLLGAVNRMNELVPNCHTEGTICLSGMDLLSPSANLTELRRRVGTIFQQPTPFPVSIRKNFHLPLRDHGYRRAEEREALMEGALREVGLWNEVAGRLNCSALELSGGQQQRLCIARALVLRPEVMLFDEPCSALDPLSSANVEEYIGRLKNELTVVIVTHNLGQARRLADRIAVLWMVEGAGEVVEIGSPEQIFENPTSDSTRSYIRAVCG